MTVHGRVKNCVAQGRSELTPLDGRSQEMFVSHPTFQFLLAQFNSQIFGEGIRLKLRRGLVGCTDALESF